MIQVGGRVVALVLAALLIGGGLVLAALLPGLGLVLLLAVVVIGAFLAFAAFGPARRRDTRSPELLGPGGPDDPRGDGNAGPAST